MILNPIGRNVGINFSRMKPYSHRQDHLEPHLPAHLLLLE
jgi:hypothetical protein